MLLVVALIVYRAALMFAFMSSAFAQLPEFESVFAGFSTERPPGGFGSPLILFVLIPALIVLRRFVRRGYFWARVCYVCYAGLRVLMVVVVGPYNLHAGAFILLYAASAGLLFTPAANRWFLAPHHPGPR
jgi:hypothetical protein